MSSRLHTILLLTAHLLLAGLLPGTFLYMMLPGPGPQEFYLAATGAGLALVLMVWVGVLLVRRLWQRRWGWAVALALLLVADVLALCGYQVLIGIMWMAPGPS